MPDIPQTYHIGGNSLFRTTEPRDEIMSDPRGLLHVWEPPRSSSTYIMGHDPTVGITGWSRATRTDADRKVDNGAIEIFRVDGVKQLKYTDHQQPDNTFAQVPDIDPITKQQRFFYRDIQVAEYFAPNDPVELARVCSVLGRVYCGDADEYCELIYESMPGPGILTTQELLRLNYSNLWYWEYIDGVAEETNRVGWRSYRDSQKLLWYRSRRHLMDHRAIIKSPWLLAEYANAVIDMDKMRAKAAYGAHDDLMTAANLCFWAGHRWTYDVDRAAEIVSETPILDFQNYAPTLGETRSYKDEWANLDWDS